MYIFVSVLLAVLYISLAVSHFFITEKKYAKFAMRFSIISGFAGFLLSGAVIAEFYIKISSTEIKEDIKDWASDVFWGYLKDILPVCAVVMALIILSSVFQPKMIVIRSAVTALSSIFVLIFGYVSSFLSENENISIIKEIFLLSIFISIMFSVCEVIDFSNLYKKLSEKT